MSTHAVRSMSTTALRGLLDLTGSRLARHYTRLRAEAAAELDRRAAEDRADLEHPTAPRTETTG
ncbi:hypothetical protein [Brevibacterium senegalense]|uniref:hypothetical protein n=1 Tax=Brevibacterium senegalense TaxID=1033736 RepID=UPI0002F7F9CB|nr:hypothetical protein [Brevibacterium senegalense]